MSGLEDPVSEVIPLMSSCRNVSIPFAFQCIRQRGIALVASLIWLLPSLSISGSVVIFGGGDMGAVKLQDFGAEGTECACEK